MEICNRKIRKIEKRTTNKPNDLFQAFIVRTTSMIAPTTLASTEIARIWWPNICAIVTPASLAPTAKSVSLLDIFRIANLLFVLFFFLLMQLIQLNPASPDPRVTEIRQYQVLSFCSYKSFLFISYTGNNENLRITDKICWSLDIRYSGASL